MYIVILIILAGIGVLLTRSGLAKGNRILMAAGILVVVATLLFFGFMDFWGEQLWFEAIGYEQRFWTMALVKTLCLGAGFLAGLIYVSLLTFSIPKDKLLIKKIAILVGSIAGAAWALSNWEVLLKFWYGVNTGLEDPILGKDVGFYLFTLPFLEILEGILFFLTLVAIAANFIAIFIRTIEQKILFRIPAADRPTRLRLMRSFYLSLGILVILLGTAKYLQRFQLMFSDWGAVNGPGWTDVNIRMPALLIISILTVLFGIMMTFPAGRRILSSPFHRLRKYENDHPAYMIFSFAVLLLIWFIVLTAVPGAFQALRVAPNEITFERPYIAHNIEFTRHGFGLNDVQEVEFPVSDQFNQQIVAENGFIFNNVRLWDWRALDAVYKQFQEIRLYYEFYDVDIDRYVINDTLRQVMISARELEPENLPVKSQTFVNQRFKYTHGYGITLTTVNEFDANGLPRLLIKNIPPKSSYPELVVERPQIYYGELTTTHVVVNSAEQEFDYPSGEENVYVNYQGKGGVELSNIWRKFLFGWKFDGTKFFFSSYPTKESRIMFHRQINERVQKLAPFLKYDEDPYIVLADGKLYWMIDAYTISSNFPYSEPFTASERIEYTEGDQKMLLNSTMDPALRGINYIRNSVKVVIDAYDGSVDFYIFDEKDPLVMVWDKIFPGLFKTKSAMPPSLLDHIRYPADLLLVQGLVYSKYHMTDPTVFYNQEDLWIRATEKYYSDIQPVAPYYVIWKMPGSDQPQFILMLPFTPKNRQVMIGWIAGLSNPENYGKFLAYKFPKEKRVLGPQQVETKIDQDRFLSGQLSLWDQRGSNVIRGNVLAIPVGNTIIYVEPIYLQAETAAYPELRLVVVMHNDKLSYAESFDEALAGLIGEKTIQEKIPGVPEEAEPEDKPEPDRKPVTATQQALIEKANNAFNNYIEYTGQKRFKEASEALEELRITLQQLMQESEPQ